MIDQVCWHEMDVDDELTLRSAGRVLPQARDRPAPHALRAGSTCAPTWWSSRSSTCRRSSAATGFGMSGHRRTRAVSDPRNDVVGHYYIDQLQDRGGPRRRSATPGASASTSRPRPAPRSEAREIFDGILERADAGADCRRSRPGTRSSCGAAPSSVLMDLADRPDFMHRLVGAADRVPPGHARPARGAGPAGLAARTASTAPARTRTSCPRRASTRRSPRAQDLWTFGMAQIFSTVSPAMHEEFELRLRRSAGTSASASATTAAASRWTRKIDDRSARSPTCARSP